MQVRGILNEAQPGVSRKLGGRAPGALKQTCVTVERGLAGVQVSALWRSRRGLEYLPVYPFCCPCKLERG